MGKPKASIMEYLSWIDIVGPFLTTFSAIIALSGNPYNEKKKWYARLNWRGYCIALLIVISVCISLKNTSVVNATNDIKIKTEKDRYDSISAKYETIKDELSASTRSGDSLNREIDGLRRTLIEVTLLDLKENRRIAEENRKIILHNLLQEIVENILTLDVWEEAGKNSFEDMSLPVERFSIVRLKDSQSISLNSKLVTRISLVIKRIESINIGLNELRNMP